MVDGYSLVGQQNKTKHMATSTCCGAETTMPEYGICPDCLEHCDWEEEETDKTN